MLVLGVLFKVITDVATTHVVISDFLYFPRQNVCAVAWMIERMGWGSGLAVLGGAGLTFLALEYNSL